MLSDLISRLASCRHPPPLQINYLHISSLRVAEVWIVFRADPRSGCVIEMKTVRSLFRGEADRSSQKGFFVSCISYIPISHDRVIQCESMWYMIYWISCDMLDGSNPSQDYHLMEQLISQHHNGPLNLVSFWQNPRGCAEKTPKSSNR